MSERRKEMEKGGMVALFPQHNRFSWPEQSQSLQPHKTNGGKSQPGGFDPLKGLWDLINMQLYLFIWFFFFLRNRHPLQCLSRTLIFTRINKNIWSMWIKYQPLAEHSAGRHKDTRAHAAATHARRESLVKEAEAIKIFSWLLPDYAVKVRKPDRYYLPALRGTSECAVQAFSPSRFSRYGFPSPRHLHHTVSSCTQQAPLPQPAFTIPWEDGATREKLIEI